MQSVPTAVTVVNKLASSKGGSEERVVVGLCDGTQAVLQFRVDDRTFAAAEVGQRLQLECESLGEEGVVQCLPAAKAARRERGAD